jgi:hypothetical protein
MAEHLVFRTHHVTGAWIPLILDGQQLKVDSAMLPEMFTIALLHGVEPVEFEGPSGVYVLGATRYEPMSVFNKPAKTVSTHDLTPESFR